MAGWLDKLLGRVAPVASAAPIAQQQAVDVASLVAEGNRLVEAGRMSEAGKAYTRASEADPGNVDAAVNLGFVHLQLGEIDAAVRVLERVHERWPGNVDALYMLGTIALGRGDLQRATERLEAALQAQQGFAPAFAPLTRAWVTLQRMDRASEVVDAGLALDPQEPELLFLRGNLRRLAGNAVGAIADYRAALAIVPRMGEARVPLGHLLLETGDLPGATAAFEEGLAHRPQTADLCRRLGDGLAGVGKLDAACAAYAMALELDPGDVVALLNLSNAEIERGRSEAARAVAQRLTDIAPDSVDGWLNLGAAHSRMNQHAEAERHFRKAAELAPQDARPVARLGLVALHQGRIDTAVECLDHAVTLDPASLPIQSDLLFALTYGEGDDAYLAAARRYGERVASTAEPFVSWPIADDASPAPLRVGIVSGDLRAHPVGYFIESVLPHLRAAGLDVVAFPTSVHDDEVTRRLRAACGGWVPIAAASDRAAAHRIRDQRIHVLLDLTGHSGHQRLPVFALRPAPVQASWLGYWASTGLSAIDYLIADPVSVPQGEEGRYVESVWRLPETRLCFTAPGTDETHPVTPLPALREGVVTFGSYQSLNKVNVAVLDAWRRVLDAVPHSRLRLQNPQTGAAAEAAVRARVVAAGIDPARLRIAPPADRASYLRSYAEVDLLLDTFPFPGGTTTCEALWMGVPTVSLGGRSMVANQGRLILSNAGLGDWVASDVDSYVALAAEKATRLQDLACLRERLRAQVLASPLFDAPRFAGHLADALRGMWATRRRG